MTTSTIHSVAISAAAFGSLITTSHAAVYVGTAYEGFDYSTAVGSPTDSDGQLNANSGGSGFNPTGDGALANTTAWGGTGVSQQSGSTLIVSSSILGGVGSPIGNRAEIAGVTTTNGQLGRSLGQSVDTGSLYFSYLTERNNDSQRTVAFSLYTGATERYTFGQIGQGTGVSLVTTNGDFAGRTGGANVSTVGTPVAYGTEISHFVVGRVDFNVSGALDRVRVYLDPTDLSDESLLTAYVDSTTTDLGAIDAFRLFAGNTNATFLTPGSGDFDEVRFGNSFASVTVIPEPSVLASLALSAGFLLRRRRSGGAI